ncbi:hypothetical protein [Candidatus Aquicultor sp.]
MMKVISAKAGVSFVFFLHELKLVAIQNFMNIQKLVASQIVTINEKIFAIH